MSQLFTSGGQSPGVSASTSVLPVNTQDWSPLGWISLKATYSAKKLELVVWWMYPMRFCRSPSLTHNRLCKCETSLQLTDRSHCEKFPNFLPSFFLFRFFHSLEQTSVSYLHAEFKNCLKTCIERFPLIMDFFFIWYSQTSNLKSL